MDFSLPQLAVADLFDPTAGVEAFLLVLFAEMGDRSQIACMVLGARYRPLPVLLGAVAAFFLLDGLAGLLGGALGALLPQRPLTGIAALLFFFFAFQAAREAPEEAEEETPRAARSVFLLAFTTLVLAELGDKTWLAVAARSAVGHPIAVWLGATLGLSFTSALGVFAGRWILARLAPTTLRRLTVGTFLVMGLMSGLRALWPPAT